MKRRMCKGPKGRAHHWPCASREPPRWMVAFLLGTLAALALPNLRVRHPLRLLHPDKLVRILVFETAPIDLQAGDLPVAQMILAQVEPVDERGGTRLRIHER